MTRYETIKNYIDELEDYDSEPGGDCCCCEHLEDCRNGKPCKCDEVTPVYNPNLR